MEVHFVNTPALATNAPQPHRPAGSPSREPSRLRQQLQGRMTTDTAVAASILTNLDGVSAEDQAQRVTIWHRVEQRKIAGTAAPLRRNLKRYLVKNIDCDVYINQDLCSDSRTGEIDQPTGRRVTRPDRVIMWNRRTRTRITGNAAPLRRNLSAYFLRNPDNEIYNGQDGGGLFTSAARQTRMAGSNPFVRRPTVAQFHTPTAVSPHSTVATCNHTSSNPPYLNSGATARAKNVDASHQVKRSYKLKGGGGTVANFQQPRKYVTQNPQSDGPVQQFQDRGSSGATAFNHATARERQTQKAQVRNTRKPFSGEIKNMVRMKPPLNPAMAKKSRRSRQEKRRGTKQNSNQVVLETPLMNAPGHQTSDPIAQRSIRTFEQSQMRRSTQPPYHANVQTPVLANVAPSRGMPAPPANVMTNEDGLPMYGSIAGFGSNSPTDVFVRTFHALRPASIMNTNPLDVEFRNDATIRMIGWILKPYEFLENHKLFFRGFSSRFVDMGDFEFDHEFFGKNHVE